MKLIMASGNQGKLKEVKAILNNYDIYSKDEVGLRNFEVEENQETIRENSAKKAREVYGKVEYLLPSLGISGVFADDTGFFIDVLGGAPGVHAARFAGDHDDQANIQKVLELMKGEENRNAFFQTVVWLKGQNGDENHFSAILVGTIATEPKGENGFGYDSIFIPKGETRTLAEMTDEEKNAISHRREALILMKKYIDSHWEDFYQY